MEIMKKAQSLPIPDYLFLVMPELRHMDIYGNQYGPILYDLWKKFGNENKILIPNKLDKTSIKKMELCGLIKNQSDYSVITDKGKKLLNKMILSDNSSSLDSLAKKSSLKFAGFNWNSQKVDNWYKKNV